MSKHEMALQQDVAEMLHSATEMFEVESFGYFNRNGRIEAEHYDEDGEVDARFILTFTIEEL